MKSFQFRKQLAAALLAAGWLLAAAGNPLSTQLGLAAAMAAVGVILWRIELVRDFSKSQAEIRETRRRLAWSSAVLEPIEEGLLALDSSGRPSYANRRLWQILAHAPMRPAAMQLDLLLGKHAAASFQAAVAEAIAERRAPEPLEWPIDREDGSRVTLTCSLRPIDSGGLRLGWLAAFRDVSHERLVERSRQVLAKRLEFLFREMPLACILWDLDFQVAEWNTTAGRIFGWTEAEAGGRSYHELLGGTQDDEMTKVWTHVRQGLGPQSSQCRHRTRDDSSVDVEWFHTALLNESGAVVGVASMGHDVTRRLLLEQELAQAQKMEAVGSLAGGIAHDFNNLLTAILGNLAMLQLQTGPSHPAAKGLREGVQAAERAAELTQQLLRFSRRSPCELRPVDPRNRIEEAIQLFAMGSDRTIELEYSIADDLWLTNADETQIAQVLMNLLVNARDALPSGGRIRVNARNRRMNRRQRRERSWATQRDYVEIEVIDNGCGISESIQSRIFEPFFTTKPVGKGTGLGLATAYGIIQRHRGGLEVDSELGEGAAFRLLLPRHEPQKVRSAEERGGLVLLVEPDSEAAQRACEVLEAAGYTPLSAADRSAGLELLREESARLSLAILSLRLPDGSGAEIIAEARQLRPELPLLVTSDRVFDNWSEPGSALLKRPYGAAEMEAAVRMILASHEQR